MLTKFIPVYSSILQEYLSCLKDEKDVHYKCKELSKSYLQCRMDNELMAKEDLNEMGYGEEQRVKGEVTVYDKSKERAGYVAGKHIEKPNEWWWQRKKRDWNS